MGEKSSAKTTKDMITENKENKSTKGLIDPEEANKSKKKSTKKISVGKNDIVEREESIITDDGRQLLK